MKFVVVLVSLLLSMVLWVRLAKDDPAIWHIDPLVVALGDEANAYLLLPDGPGAKGPVFDVPAQELAGAFDKVAVGNDRVTRLAQEEDGLWVTYVQRSNLMRFPDYISVRFIDLADGKATLAIYSRSRFGRSDLGVNKARVKSWISALGPLVS